MLIRILLGHIGRLTIQLQHVLQCHFCDFIGVFLAQILVLNWTSFSQEKMTCQEFSTIVVKREEKSHSLLNLFSYAEPKS